MSRSYRKKSRRYYKRYPRKSDYNYKSKRERFNGVSASDYVFKEDGSVEESFQRQVLKRLEKIEKSLEELKKLYQKKG